MKKFRSVMDEKMGKILTKIDELEGKDNFFELTYGQLTALATTNIG